jgi:glyoxylase-like metal-dependent hydrolase (beta-lactamase superfamily II)
LPLNGDKLRAIDVYAIDGGDGIDLVDSGAGGAQGLDALQRGLRQIGRDLCDIKSIVCTHLHYDHYSLGLRLRRDFGTPLSLPEGEQPALHTQCSVSSPYGTQIRALVNNGAADLAHYLTSTAGALPIIDVDWEEPDLWLRPGETLQSAGQDLQTFATPGHTRGHMFMVADEAGVIFVGDHVLPHITPSIGVEPLGNRSPLADYMWSLDAMTTLPDLALLPGHGPAGGSLHARAAELMDHHRDRLEQSLTAMCRGAATAH